MQTRAFTITHPFCAVPLPVLTPWTCFLASTRRSRQPTSARQTRIKVSCSTILPVFVVVVTLLCFSASATVIKFRMDVPFASSPGYSPHSRYAVNTLCFAAGHYVTSHAWKLQQKIWLGSQVQAKNSRRKRFWRLFLWISHHLFFCHEAACPGFTASMEKSSTKRKKKKRGKSGMSGINFKRGDELKVLHRSPSTTLQRMTKSPRRRKVTFSLKKQCPLLILEIMQYHGGKWVYTGEVDDLTNKWWSAFAS